MSSSSSSSIKLKVAEAEYADVGRGIARIDSQTMEALGVTTGDIIEISGKRKTAAVAWRSRLQDEGAGLIRIDGVIRKNAGASLGDFIYVKKADAKPAKQIVLAPVEQIYLRGNVEAYFKHRILNKPAVKGDLIVFEVMGQTVPFVVAQTSPKGVVYVTEATEFKISEKPMKPGDTAVPDVTYEDIGGLHEEIKKIREMVELPLKHPELFRKLGIEPPKGVLLYGPPGTGKTLLAKAVANEANAYFLNINGPEIMSKYYGESERRLREIFEEAEKNSPAIVFIDEIDAIAPRRDEVSGEVERRVVSQLLTLMDGLKGRGQVIVIAATNRPDAVDPALRRPGRFDREIEIGVPDRKGRKEILQIHTRGMPLAKDVDLEKLADLTYGFTGADISMLSKEAAMKSLRRMLPEIIHEKGEIPEEIPAEVLNKLEVRMEDFRKALQEIEPSGMRDVMIEVPRVKWEDIGDLEDVKKELKEAVEWPLKYPQTYEQLGIEPPRGVLLYGPPGCGKTLLAKAVANQANANFIAVKGPEVLSKWVGESERAIRKIFRKARQVAPCIVFFDEIDSIANRRGSDSSKVSDRVLNQILTELDGIEKLRGVMVLAATNRPDLIDPALLRPGRFDKLIYVPIPNKEARLQVLKVHTRKMPLAEDVELEKVAEKTEGYTGADLAALCREAAMTVVREAVKKADSVRVLAMNVVEGREPVETLEAEVKGIEKLEEIVRKAKEKGMDVLRDALMEIKPEMFMGEVTMAHFKEALLKIRRSLNDEELRFYEKLRDWSG